MKNFVLSLICLLTITYTTSSVSPDTLIQETETIEGTYKGCDEEGYSFIVDYKNGESDIIVFQGVVKEALVKHNLKDIALIGKKFKVTYLVEMEADENDESDIETYTILTLKKVKK